MSSELLECYSYYSIALLLLVFTSTATDDLTSFTLITSTDQSADTIGTVIVTLWFNFTIYEYTFNDGSTHITSSDTTYTIYKHSSPSFQELGSSICNDAETKVMIQNTNNNDLYIDKVKLNTASGIWYGIDSICAVNDIKWNNIQQSWLLSEEDPLCGDSNHNNHYNISCVGISNDCVYDKQIIYFDTTKSNQYITHAKWENALNITPQTISCNPTNNPTQSSLHTLQYIINTYELLIYITASLLGAFCCSCCVFCFIKALFTKEKNRPTDRAPTHVELENNAPLNITLGEMNVVGVQSKSVSSASNPKYDGDTEHDPMLIHWIRNRIELPEYLEHFLGNGYNNMDDVLKIDDAIQLEDIGIRKKGHQTLIISEIARLRRKDVQRNGNDSDDSAAWNESDVVKINMSVKDVVCIPKHHQVQINIPKKTAKQEVIIVERGPNELIMDELIADMTDLPPSLGVKATIDVDDVGDVYTVEGDEEEVVINISKNKNNINARGHIEEMLQIAGEDVNDLTDLGDIVAGR